VEEPVHFSFVKGKLMNIFEGAASVAFEIEKRRVSEIFLEYA